MLDFFYQKTYNFFVKPFIAIYLKKVRWFNYEGLRLKIYPEVFHPGFFFSTKVFASFINTLDLKNKHVCEVGAGSGLLSFISFKKGANVTCFDISPKAIKGLEENLILNFKEFSEFKIYQSDLFDSVPNNQFAFFFINPPYFFKDPTNLSSLAWYCGKDGQYFEKLFVQLPNYSTTTSQIFMILASNCDVEAIRHIAKKNNFILELVHEKKIKWEKNYIFKIVKV